MDSFELRNCNFVIRYYSINPGHVNNKLTCFKSGGKINYRKETMNSDNKISPSPPSDSNVKTRGSLMSGLTILEAFVNGDGELSLSELTEATGLTATTVHRLVSILMKRGYVQQAHKRGKYSLTVKFLQFASFTNARMRIREISYPFMLELRRLAGESVSLTIWEGNRPLYLDTVPSHHSLQVSPVLIQSDDSLHNTAIGKLLLASFSDADLDRFLADTVFKQETPNTIGDVKELKKQLRDIKKQGFAIDYEEREIGVGNISSPIRDAGGTIVGTIGILGPTARLKLERMIELAPLVKKTALNISGAIGYSGQ
jgi:DNA-binding IclR family transcriptional regulator